MSERRDEFEALLERTLRERMNARTPERMVERIAGAAGREVVVVRRRAGAWPIAVAVCFVMAVAFCGLKGKRGCEGVVAPEIALQRTPAARVGMMPSATSDVVPGRGHVGGAERRRARASGWEVRVKDGPKLETFPSTAINPPRPEPGSMEAQLQVLISLPPSTLAQMAEDQAKQQKERAEMQEKLN